MADDIRVKFTPQGVDSILGALNKIKGTLAGVFAIGGLTALVASTMEAIDSQAKLARELRATTTGLETMKRAAGLAGIETDKMTKATRFLDIQLGKALQGEKAQADAFQRLGLNLAEFSKLDADRRIEAINKALMDNVPAAERASIAAEMYGAKMGAAISRVNSGDFQAAREEVEALGLAVNDIDSRTIERANDSFSVLGEVVRGAANRFTVALGPALEAIANKIRAVAVENRGFENEIEMAFDIAIRLAGKLGDSWHGLQLIFKTLQTVLLEGWAAVLNVIAMVPEAQAKMVDAVIDGINFIIKAINRLPGMSIPEIIFEGHKEVPKFLRGMADSVAQTAAGMRSELESMAAEPLPSELLERWLDDVRKASAEASRLAAQEDVAGAGTGSAAAKIDKELAKKLERLREALRTEEESERLSHQKRISEIKDFYAKQMIGEQEFNELMARETSRHEEVMRGFQAKRDEQWMKIREQRMADLESLKAYILTEEEVELAAHQKRLENLVLAAEELNMTEEEYRRLREELELKHQAKMGDISAQGVLARRKFESKSMREQAQTIFGELANVTAGVAQHNRALFNLNKVAGIANAILNAHVGISRTLSSYPFPWNIAMAAAHGAAAFAQVNAIRSQSFGGGGAAPSLAGSTAATPVSAVEGGAPAALGSGGSGSGGNRNLNIQLHGTIFGRDQIEQLVNGINEFMGDGGSLKVKVQS